MMFHTPERRAPDHHHFPFCSTSMWPHALFPPSSNPLWFSFHSCGSPSWFHTLTEWTTIQLLIHNDLKSAKTYTKHILVLSPAYQLFLVSSLHKCDLYLSSELDAPKVFLNKEWKSIIKVGFWGNGLVLWKKMQWLVLWKQFYNSEKENDN